MGCDYYITTSLHIYYNNNEYLGVELNRERAYYNWDYDEDEDDYDEKIKDYIKFILTPQKNPIIIYTNSSFNKVTSELKYKSLVEDIINKYNKSWPDIVKIIKIEKRNQV